jgi:hypothetical protein
MDGVADADGCRHGQSDRSQSDRYQFVQAQVT